jgi:hypothetical protein
VEDRRPYVARRARKLRPDVSSNLDVYASEVETDVAEALGRTLARYEGTVALLAEVQCHVPVHHPEHRYLDLLGALHRLARRAANSLGGEIDLDLRVSRRSVEDTLGPRPLDVYDAPWVLGTHRPADGVRITGFDVEPYRGLDCAAGYVAVDFAAIKVRRAFKAHQPPGAEQVAARIRQELRARGVSDELTRAAVADLRGSELQRARALWLRRYGQPAASPAERARQMRFLAARGFSGDVIRKVVGGEED